MTRAVALPPELDAMIERERGGESRSAWVAQACRERLERLDTCACRAGLCTPGYCADCADCADGRR